MLEPPRLRRPITYLELSYGAIGKKADPKHQIMVDGFINRVDQILPFDRLAVAETAKVK